MQNRLSVFFSRHSIHLTAFLFVHFVFVIKKRRRKKRSAFIRIQFKSTHTHKIYWKIINHMQIAIVSVFCCWARAMRDWINGIAIENSVRVCSQFFIKICNAIKYWKKIAESIKSENSFDLFFTNCLNWKESRKKNIRLKSRLLFCVHEKALLSIAWKSIILWMR